MQVLNKLQIEEVSGGLHPFLEGCVLTLPAIGAVEGGMQAWRAPAENNVETFLNVAAGAGVGFVAGLMTAIAAVVKTDKSF